MCDYSLRALASRPAQVGETLVSTVFKGTSTRGFASERDPSTAVCMLPGTELVFAENIRYDNRYIWPKTLDTKMAKFTQIDPHLPDRHHDAIETVAGEKILVTQLCEGQRVTVLQLPAAAQLAEAKSNKASASPPAPAGDDTIVTRQHEHA